ncbi:RcnB family protein [Stenotrophomonas sp. NLF4-10]|uniref:RcnB family protein n=1 Tax=Stenotrophomonas sp. NLF4-10 TaxID=2918754 RepID=UPI001EFB3FB9|nr:RcnB family protein [Stenotrophomonas sp. NLF4-10]MCG8277683.1 RcnB family protein [Stenotrophomonas sp. NLF4-10]
MFPSLRNAGLVLALAAFAGTAPAMAHDDGRWQGHGNDDPSGKPEWQVREEQRQREQARREQEQQRQRQEEQRRLAERQQRRSEAAQLRQEAQQRRVAEQQRRRDEAWQRSQEQELRRRAEQQRRHDAAWQREQEAIQRRRAAAQGHPASHGSHPHWERGRRYDGPVNVVRDWDRHHLRQPAHGQQWVRTDGGDYLLLEIANQLIVDMLSR